MLPDAPANVPVARPRPRRQALASVVILGLVGALLYALVEVRASSPHLQALAADACRGNLAARAELRRYLHWMLALMPTSTVGFAGYVAILAHRVRRTDAFPPHGMITLRPARTFTGPAARRIGAVMLVFAAVLVALAVLLTATGLRMLAALHR